jgi:glycosyltransferase involved in cell wall biosynthesis
MVGHPCWGDLLFVDSVFPSVPLVAVMELDLLGVDLRDLEATLGASLQSQHRSELALRAWTDLLAARRMVAGLTATHFQRATYPTWLRQRIVVMHEGVDIRACQPDPLARFRLSAERSLGAADPVISFAARFLEPMRGFPVLMRAIPAVQRAIPGVQVVLAGNPVGTAYGPGPTAAASWKDAVLRELDGQIQLSHVHFCGLLPHQDLIRLFQITTVHVYLTYPFVLSWSLMEAMACGALVVGSRTPPVQEVIQHGQNGLLVGMDDPGDLARQLIEVLRQPSVYRRLRHAARRSMVEHYERTVCMKRQIEWLQQLCRSE